MEIGRRSTVCLTVRLVAATMAVPLPNELLFAATMAVPLPNELLFAIFVLFPLSPAGAIDLARCSLVCRRFRVVACADELWSEQYLARWQTAHNDDGKDWKSEYGRRHAQDGTIDDLLASMIRSPRRRITHAEQILAMDTEAVDRLEMHKSAIPPELRPDGASTSNFLFPEIPHDWLARSHWAGELLAVRNRQRALQEWGSLRKARFDFGYLTQGRTFEQAIACFSAFRGGDVDEVIRSSLASFLAELTLCMSTKITHALYSLSKRLKLDLEEKGLLPVRPGNLRELARGITDFMRAEGFSGADIVHYHDLSNHFLHIVLDTQKHTLPMSLACIFVGLARRVGVRAFPINTPRHIFVVVQGYIDPSIAVLEDEVPFYVDAFSEEDQTILGEETVLDFVGNLNVPRDLARELLVPSDTIAMALRTSRNIFASIRQHDGSARTLIGSAYAAAAVRAILSDNASERNQAAMWIAPMIRQAFPLDVGLLESMSSYATEPSRLLKTAEQIREVDEEGEPEFCKRRTDDRLKYRVGQVFRHGRQGYIGVVTGWDAQCEQEQNWIDMMGIDHLACGRRQPFYHSMVADSTTRYVAEENIRPVETLEWSDVKSIMRAHDDLGLLFSRIDFEARRFMPAADLIASYPDD
jgi:F-box protein 21